MMRRCFWFCLVWTFLLGGSCDSFSQKPVELEGSALGTTYSIKLIASPGISDTHQLHVDLRKAMAAVEASMSVHNPNSEISKFNRSSDLGWFKISSDLFEVIRESVVTSRISAGYFDITIGNLVEAWGFGTTRHPISIPDQSTIDQALLNSGYSGLYLSDKNDAIRKTIPGLTINLSAIAKGFTVDVVARLLEQKGVARYLVEIGGEIRTKGLKQGDKPWLVAIERPEADKRSFYKIIELSGFSMATSGDYRNFYEIAGKRYAHTINPHTGWPVKNSIASVSVIHASCMTADALATTLMSMGYDKGSRFAREHDLSVFWILRSDNGMIEKRSEAFNFKLFQ